MTWKVRPIGALLGAIGALSLVQQAVGAGIITPAEADLVAEAEEARNDAIQVDSFGPEDYMATAPREGQDDDGREAQSDLGPIPLTEASLYLRKPISGSNPQAVGRDQG